MKKAILVTSLVIASSLTAKAQIICGVMAEEKAGEYTKTLATKFLEETEHHVEVYKEGNLVYGVNIESDGGLTLAVFDPSAQTVKAMAYGKNPEMLSLIVPDLKKSLACSKAK